MKNIEKIIIKNLKYYENNKDKYKENKKEFYGNNKEKKKSIIKNIIKIIKIKLNYHSIPDLDQCLYGSVTHHSIPDLNHWFRESLLNFKSWFSDSSQHPRLGSMVQ